MTNMTNANYDRKVLTANLTKVWADAEWKGVTKAELLWLEEIALVLSGKQSRGMSATLLRYRAGYEETIAYSGRKSLSNGDAIAEFLAGLTPDDVLAKAERILGLETGFLADKYQNLNEGQKRMNGGNRLRAAMKRGDITPAELH